MGMEWVAVGSTGRFREALIGKRSGTELKADGPRSPGGIKEPLASLLE